MSTSQTPPPADAGDGPDGAASRTVVPLGDLSKKQLKQLKATVPDTYSGFGVPGGTDVTKAVLIGSAMIPLVAIAANSQAVLTAATRPPFMIVFFAIAALIYFLLTSASRGGDAANQVKSLKPLSVGVARQAIKSAIEGSKEALELELHLVSYPNRNGMSFELPALGARWDAAMFEQDEADALVAAVKLKQLDASRQELGGSAPRQDQWVKEWLARRPAVRERSGDHGDELDALVMELGDLLDPAREAPTDAEDTLATMRKDCDEAVTIYCEFAPTETNVVLRSGKTATGEVIQLLELVADEARRIRRQGTITKGDELSFLVRLNKARFTRSDLELP